MNNEMSILSLVMDASLLVKLVMLALLVASLVSWVIILGKRTLLSSMRRRADKFEEAFWSGGNLATFYEQISRSKKPAGGIEELFKEGFEEFRRQRESGESDPEEALVSIQRSLRVANVREIERLESGVPILATIGSTSPYVGLFGTVWGIMNAFIAIGNVKQATIAMVAPGIAEALIATAMGLVAAIPAVIAYNMFTSQIERLEARFHTFSEELVGLLEKAVRQKTGAV